MKQTFEPGNVPQGYPLCLNRECPHASTCLKQLAEQAMPDDKKYWNIISPRYQAAQQGECSDYRPDKKIYYAQGFMNILGELTVNQYNSVVLGLIRMFGKRSYYRVRKGERLLSPAEQKKVQNLFKRNGVEQPWEFDAYIEDYEW
ncbi:MAG: DUF6078 family protein [Parabacteroides sp.]|nr:DUF6078 family protein [Parabacteroides sp.]